MGIEGVDYFDNIARSEAASLISMMRKTLERVTGQGCKVTAWKLSRQQDAVLSLQGRHSLRCVMGVPIVILETTDGR